MSRGVKFRSIHDELKGRFAAQCLGVWTGSVSFFHDPLCLLTIQFRKQGMHFNGQSITTLIIFDQTDQSACCGFFDGRAQSLGGIDQGSVVASGIGTSKQHFGIRTPRFDPLLQWVTQGDVKQTLR